MDTGRRILAIDIGNTAVKVSLFDGMCLEQSISGTGGGIHAVETMLALTSPNGVAVSCVGSDKDGIMRMLGKTEGLQVVDVATAPKLPIKITGYDRAKLGADRIAAACGAMESDSGVLVVDAGTAITSDLVWDAEFFGGNISPGISLRFKSLNLFTSKLPMVTASGELHDFGHDTEQAIRSGVMGGVVAQIESEYHAAQRAIAQRAAEIGEPVGALRLLLTGGDADLLAPLLAHRGITASVDHQAVGRGLVRIFNEVFPVNTHTHIE